MRKSEVFVFQNKFFQGMLALFMIAGAVLLSLSTAWAADDKWRAEYFNNRTLSGDPAIVVMENEINHDWGDGTPFGEVNKDAFSVRWKRTVAFASSGTYRFLATTDDGMRAWLDDVLIIDSWTDSQVHTVSKDVYVPAGDHRLRVEYYEAGGKAVAKFNWTQVSANNPPGPILNWRGEYYNNTTLSGAPVLVRDDAQINFDWAVGSPAPGVASDKFSVRWSRFLNLSSGKYRFTTTADDGVRLWVNGVLVLDQWKDQAATTTNVEVTVTGGNIPVVMEYYDNLGGAVAKLSYVQVSGSPTPPPSTGVWYAEYFNNKNLSGTPLSTRNEQVIDYNWGYGSPVPNVINVDTFSARWTGSFNMAAGRYRFTATSDDGIRVYVNNQLVINNWTDHQVQTVTGDIDLPGGVVTIKVEYYENSLLAEAHVSWMPIAGGPTNPPSGGYSATVNTARLNVRSGPGVTNPRIAGLSRGTTVTMVGIRAVVGTSTWVQIDLGRGTKGWVNARFLNTSANIGQFPLWNK